MGVFNSNMNLIVSVVSLILLVTIYFAFKYKISLWWLNFWYSLPFIGKLTRLSKDTTRYSKDNSWTNAERTLCDDYKEFVHFSDETTFKRRLNYLSKAQDTGRTPLPSGMYFVLAFLLILEGLGFSYLLGTWMAMEGSENTHTTLMLAIVLVLAGVMLIITHQAGQQLYRTNLIRRCNKEWRDDGQPGRFASHPELALQKDLENDRSLDEDQPAYTQCVNRVGTSGNYFHLYVAIVAIVVIAVTSTWMRVKHLEAMQTQETVGMPAEAADPSNPFASLGELDVIQKKADSRSKEDLQKATKDEGIMAFAMLGFIFIITQIVGITAGYKWGFAGKNSKDAYKGTRGFASYDDYLNFYEPVIQTAQSKLQTLQQRMAEQHSNKSLQLKKAFTDYIIEKTAERDQMRNLDKRAQGANHSERSPEPVQDNTQGVHTDHLETHIEKLASMGDDKDSKKAYIGELDPAMKQQVMEHLKREKEAREAAKRKEDEELEGLL